MVFSGKYKTGEQILRLANERFAVPEMLFHPSDIGIQEMGIPEAIVHSIQAMPEGETKTFEAPSVNLWAQSVCEYRADTLRAYLTSTYLKSSKKM